MIDLLPRRERELFELLRSAGEATPARLNSVSGASVTKGWGKNRKMMLCAGVALGLLAPATRCLGTGDGHACTGAGAPAPSPPAAEQPPGPEPQPEENDIVVTAPAQQSSIDRQTYIVRDTPEARSTTTNDILARIPSVEVQADGTVRLIGAGSATVLIDGRRVADPQTQLRNMTGNQIERIEVMTNPGAQFPAQGTGGIVNIVTRRNTQSGLGGSATASGGSYGSYDLRVSPTYGAGNWTFTGSFGHGRGENRNRFERDRFLLAPGGPLPLSSEEGRQTDEFRYYYGNGSASYRPDDRRTITLAGTLAHTDLAQDRPSLLTAAAIPGGSADQLSTNDANFNYRDLALDYRGTTARQGELLTASVKWARFSGDFDSLFLVDPAAGPANSFQQQRTMSDENWTGKVDYVRPFGGANRLSLGAQLVTTSNRFVQNATGALPSGTPFAASSVVDGSWLEYAGYLTYQFALAGFTIMPGVRLEGREYDLGGTTGVPDLKTTRLFPSLHMERQLAPWLTGSASYSRRITYPPIQLLNPALNFSDSTAAQAGNPLLQPQLTDSWEIRLRGTVARHNLELTAYPADDRGHLVLPRRGRSERGAGDAAVQLRIAGADRRRALRARAASRGAALRAHRQRLGPGPRSRRRRPAAGPAQRHLVGDRPARISGRPGRPGRRRPRQPDGALFRPHGHRLHPRQRLRPRHLHMVARLHRPFVGRAHHHQSALVGGTGNDHHGRDHPVARPLRPALAPAHHLVADLELPPARPGPARAAAQQQGGPPPIPGAGPGT